MQNPKHLNQAPIVEAVINLAVNPPSGFDVKRLLEIQKKLGDGYPTVNEMRQNTIEFKLGQTASSASENHVVGYRFTSKDNLYIAQVRSDEFIFSRLKPYSSWEEFSAEARKVWGYYSAIVTPTSSVKRIAVRFINRLKLPLPAKFEDFLTVPPRIPEGLAQNSSGFFSQINIEDTQSKITSALIQFTEPLVDPAFFTVIIDISAFRQGDFEVDEDKIWSILQTLRDAKNRAFFSSVTEKTIKLHE